MPPTNTYAHLFEEQEVGIARSGASSDMMDRLCGTEKGDITSKLLKICFTEDGEDKCFTCDNDSYTVSFTSREFFSYISRIDVDGFSSCGIGYVISLRHYALCSIDGTTQTKMYLKASHKDIELTNW